MKGESGFQTLSGCRLEGLNFPPAMELINDHSLQDVPAITQKDVISNSKDKRIPLPAAPGRSTMLHLVPTRVHFNMHPHAHPIDLPTTTITIKCWAHISAFQLSHPPVDCVR